VVASGTDSTVALRTEEERAGKQERSLLATVTTEQTLEGCSLLEGAVSVVDPSVLNDVAIRSHVGVIHGHADLRVVTGVLVDGWLVHVVPDTVHVVGALEDRGVEKILPVVASAFVEEIDPDRFSGTALSLEGLFGVGITDEKIGKVLFIDGFALLGHTLFVHEVIVRGAHVGVGGDDKATLVLINSLVHVHQVELREAFVVELTVLVVLSILTVEPEYIDGEAEIVKVVVAFNDLLRGVILPLGEVVSERVD